MNRTREKQPLLRDYLPPQDSMRAEVLAGLRGRQKTLPSKLLYDERGSELFEQICETEEYYPTRTELGILRGHGPEIGASIGAQPLLIEYGSGSSRKTRILLDHLEDPVGYVPIEISRHALQKSSRSLAAAYPGLEVLPVCADYTTEFPIPQPTRQPACRLLYFPGSTIGNFEPARARDFLAHMGRMVGRGGSVLLGVDLKKQTAVLEKAYNDPKGVTAAFNCNILRHINRELGARFPLDIFHHRSIYNAEKGRVEMHLVCERELALDCAGATIHFGVGETIHTENSYKYSLAEFAVLAGSAQLRVARVWTDSQDLFSVQQLLPEPAPRAP